MYHAFRLYFEMDEMVKKRSLIVFFEGERRSFLLGIRFQERGRQEYLQDLLEKLEQVSGMEMEMPLTVKSQWEELEQWLKSYHELK